MIGQGGKNIMAAFEENAIALCGERARIELGPKGITGDEKKHESQGVEAMSVHGDPRTVLKDLRAMARLSARTSRSYGMSWLWSVGEA